MVRDVDALLAKLKAGGATVVSVDGEAVNIGANARIAIVRDPNNLFLELIQRKAQP
jgi:predicted enzyme related to lactoylglutathione lyase